MASYDVVKLVGNEVAPAGQRISSILFRLTEEEKKKGGTKKENKCSIIPMIQQFKMGDAITSENLANALNAVLIDWQDELIRTLVVAGGAITLDDAAISLDSVLVYATTESQRKRMTKEAIAAWFEAALAEPLAIAMMPRFPNPDEDPEIEKMNNEKIAAILCSYRDGYAKLAAVKPALGKTDAERLLKNIHRAADDGMKKELMRKLELIITPPQLDLMDI